MPKKPKTETVTEALRRIIAASSFTLYELAKRSGVAYSVLHRFVARPDYQPKSGTIDRLAAVLELQLVRRRSK